MIYLSAAAASRELGISRATLYAYVSRGLIRSERGEGRARRYHASDVAALKRGAGAASAVIDCAITQSIDGALFFRGRAASDLARALSVREAAAFLWQCDPAASFAGENVPNQLPNYAAMIAALSAVPPATRALALLNVAAADEPALSENSAEAWGSAGARLLRFLAGAMAGLPPSARPVEAVLAEAWGLARDGRPLLRAAIIRSCDVELDAATVATRAASAAGSPPWRAVAAGLAVLNPHARVEVVPGLPHGGTAALNLIGRAIGLIAHAAEERASPRPFRPRARYVGPPAQDAEPTRP